MSEARLETPAFDVVTCHFGLSDIDDLDGALAGADSLLRPGGRFCGQLFGDHDDWAGSGVVFHTREELAELLAPFEVELLDVEDEDGSTTVGTTKHWHIYHVVARRL